MTYALAGGLIAGAFVVGLGLAYVMCQSKPYRVSRTQGKHRKRRHRHDPLSDNDVEDDDSDVELVEQ